MCQPPLANRHLLAICRPPASHVMNQPLVPPPPARPTADPGPPRHLHGKCGWQIRLTNTAAAARGQQARHSKNAGAGTSGRHCHAVAQLRAQGAAQGAPHRCTPGAKAGPAGAARRHGPVRVAASSVPAHHAKPGGQGLALAGTAHMPAHMPDKRRSRKRATAWGAMRPASHAGGPLSQPAPPSWQRLPTGAGRRGGKAPGLHRKAVRHDLRAASKNGVFAHPTRHGRYGYCTCSPSPHAGAKQRQARNLKPHRPKRRGNKTPAARSPQGKPDSACASARPRLAGRAQGPATARPNRVALSTRSNKKCRLRRPHKAWALSLLHLSAQPRTPGRSSAKPAT